MNKYGNMIQSGKKLILYFFPFFFTHLCIFSPYCHFLYLFIHSFISTFISFHISFYISQFPHVNEVGGSNSCLQQRLVNQSTYETILPLLAVSSSACIINFHILHKYSTRCRKIKKWVTS